MEEGEGEEVGREGSEPIPVDEEDGLEIVVSLSKGEEEEEEVDMTITIEQLQLLLLHTSNRIESVQIKSIQQEAYNGLKEKLNELDKAIKLLNPSGAAASEVSRQQQQQRKKKEREAGMDSKV